MGRRKIEIKAIKDDRNRSVTFLKRKGGLFKKAHELSVLCSVDVAVFVFGNNKKLYEYSSIDMRELIARYQYHGGPSEHKGPSDFNGGANDDDDDDDADGTPPRGLNGIESHMLPPHFGGQPQPPPPPPFSQPERRHLDLQHPPPPPPQPKDPRLEASDRPKQPFSNADMTVKKMPQRKSHSIFTPIEENRSILSLHLASFASDPPVKMEQVKVEPVKPEPGRAKRNSGAGIGTSNYSSGSGSRKQHVLLSAGPTVQRTELLSLLRGRHDRFASSAIEQCQVQIPDGSSEVDSATGGSISPRNVVESPAQVPQRHNSTAMVLPPPSPSAQTLLSAGAIGPPNPFARPPPQQNINGETPVSALPSRFLNNELLPSPNSFYPEWNLRAADSNTLPSPLNFTTPVVGVGPSFLRDDIPSFSNSITTTTTSASMAATGSSTVSVPTITTTAASESVETHAASGLGKRKSLESNSEPSHDAMDTLSDAKRLRVN
ncbi:Transcription factor RLM1 [Escovopsis weberi]|uniref:MADS-box MEF2 type transcription factor MIG1 n=1 Tax=Escovopsis weberi TaxID=150374 RepID=A0A0M9VW15_ESCWE|nr:Transcription factor RLM1 [Escovopsis weberi]